MPAPLTEMQSGILRFVEERLDVGASAPTCREICERFEFSSPKAATDHLAALERKGYISRDRKQARGIHLLHRSDEIPVLGQVPAGLPSSTNEELTGYVGFGPENFGIHDRKQAFALTVKGDSMEGCHIFDGDVVLVERGVEPHNQSIVAALIDNETTLKTFLRRGNKVWLRAENPRYPDLIPGWDLQIQGVARAVIRRLRK
ncbi:MAG: repressor LexA [Verrucomicrobiaceae bacterium]|nr:repressor LexA [Verrucomicrobiaceae bacterium]